jgi:hypothetical protein
MPTLSFRGSRSENPKPTHILPCHGRACPGHLDSKSRVFPIEVTGTSPVMTSMELEHGFRVRPFGPPRNDGKVA